MKSCPCGIKCRTKHDQGILSVSKSDYHAVISFCLGVPTNEQFKKRVSKDLTGKRVVECVIVPPDCNMSECDPF
jgi:hypothetical protein